MLCTRKIDKIFSDSHFLGDQSLTGAAIADSLLLNYLQTDLLNK